MLVAKEIIKLKHRNILKHYNYYQYDDGMEDFDKQKNAFDSILKNKLLPWTILRFTHSDFHCVFTILDNLNNDIFSVFKSRETAL